jgi:hypothetical protein
MYEDHLKTCEYCQKGSSSSTPKSKPTISVKSASSYSKVSKPTIFVKSASSYDKRKKLSELGAIIKGISYPSLELPIPMFQTKGVSEVVVATARKPGPIEREVKLKELGKMIRG